MTHKKEKFLENVKNIMASFGVSSFLVQDGTIADFLVDAPMPTMEALRKEIEKMIPIKNPTLLRNYSNEFVCSEWVRVEKHDNQLLFFVDANSCIGIVTLEEKRRSYENKMQAYDTRNA